MNNKLVPALIGGVFLGLLSSIPYLNLANVCCCGWAIIGGVIAAHLFIKRSATPVRAGEGALLGAMSGGIGSVIFWIIGLPLSLLVGDVGTPIMIRILEGVDARKAEEIRRQFEAAQNMTLVERIPSILFYAILMLVLLTLFATIGGIIGTAILEKRKHDTSVPPPPMYGDQPGGGFGAGA